MCFRLFGGGGVFRPLYSNSYSVYSGGQAYAGYASPCYSTPVATQVYAPQVSGLPKTYQFSDGLYELGDDGVYRQNSKGLVATPPCQEITAQVSQPIAPYFASEVRVPVTPSLVRVTPVPPVACPEVQTPLETFQQLLPQIQPYTAEAIIPAPVAPLAVQQVQTAPTIVPQPPAQEVKPLPQALPPVQQGTTPAKLNAPLFVFNFGSSVPQSAAPPKPIAPLIEINGPLIKGPFIDLSTTNNIVGFFSDIFNGFNNNKGGVFAPKSQFKNSPITNSGISNEGGPLNINPAVLPVPKVENQLIPYAKDEE